jgi:hypothetical protein
MAAIGAIPSDAFDRYTVLGELALDGSINPVSGVLLRLWPPTPGGRVDTSCQLWVGSSLGVERHCDPGAAIAHSTRQPFPRDAAGSFAA